MLDIVVGAKYHHWTVIDNTRVNGKIMCRCDCGQERLQWVGNLVRGLSTRCRHCASAEILPEARKKIPVWRSTQNSHLKQIRQHSDAIIEQFLEGCAIGHLAEEYGVCKDAIYALFKECGVPRRRGWRQKSLNDHAFDVLTPEACYWCGFLYADGCISRRGESYRVSIGLAIKDVAHLERFREFLGSSHAIRRSETACNFSISSVHIAQRLISLGIRRSAKKIKKGQRGKDCKVVPELASSRDFWRGCVDGDGGVRWTPRLGIDLTGSVAILTQFQEMIRGLCPHNRVNIKPNGSVWIVRVNDFDAETVASYLYDSACASLPRKAETAAKMKGYQRKTRKPPGSPQSWKKEDTQSGKVQAIVAKCPDAIWWTHEKWATVGVFFGEGRGIARHEAWALINALRTRSAEITIPHAAKLIGTRRETMWAFVRNGILPGRRVGRWHLVRRDHVEYFKTMWPIGQVVGVQLREQRQKVCDTLRRM